VTTEIPALTAFEAATSRVEWAENMFKSMLVSLKTCLIEPVEGEGDPISREYYGFKIY
jgi:hypothetical protein